jgi:hypothetical protein
VPWVFFFGCCCQSVVFRVYEREERTTRNVDRDGLKVDSRGFCLRFVVYSKEEKSTFMRLTIEEGKKT